ncbi:MAG: glycosyltransferase family 4 protein [Bacteriovoracaceae bacterium]|nr:glycosyltransferase family 4 protein [Bacteriovoracaceae bacterium]
MGRLQHFEKMKSISLYLSCDPTWGGTFQYSLSLLQSLRELEKKNLITLTVIIENDSWNRMLQTEGVKKAIVVKNNLFFKGLFKIWRTLKLPLNIWQYLGDYFHPIASVIRKTNSDLCFFPSQDSMSYFGTYRSVTTIHDLMHRYERRFPEVGNPKEYNFREYHYKNICKYSYQIMVDSSVGKDQVCESYGHIYAPKTVIIPYIIPDYLLGKKPDYSIFDRFNIPPKFFFYPAQFWMHKNHTKLIEAFSVVKKIIPDVALVLTGGKKNGYDDTLKLVENLDLRDSVIFPGYVSEEEIIALYKSTKALVMPTFFGPTNIPPLEALSLGAPVIYSRIYAYKEFLGENALFVDPNNESEIAEAMIKVLKGDNPASTYNSLSQKNIFQERLKGIIF